MLTDGLMQKNNRLNVFVVGYPLVMVNQKSEYKWAILQNVFLYEQIQCIVYSLDKI